MAKTDKFLNIWEIEQNFKCPVVGAMLSVEKHKSILKKCGYLVNQMKPYEYHSTIMGCLGDENAVSVKVNNFVRHQARRIMVEIADLAEKGEREKFRGVWKKCAAQGQIGPAMYAVVAHEDADIELLRDIHGEVHMLAHANMTEVFDIRKKLKSADDTLGREKRKVSEKHARIKELVQQRKSDAQAIDDLRAENRALQARVAELDALKNPAVPGEASVRKYEERIAELEGRLILETERTVHAEKERKRARVALFSARSENEQFREELQSLVTALSESRPGEGHCPVMDGPGSTDGMSPEMGCPKLGECEDSTCPNYRLCAKRIFMIGGITKMKSYYREIVEQAGGHFDYHDGYVKNSNIDLAAKVKRCDVVVCPVSCNSHNACIKVKKLCRRYNKELKILNSASLSAVSQALLVPEGLEAN